MMRTVNHQSEARLAQPAERKALNLVVVGSSPTVGVEEGTFVVTLSQSSCYGITHHYMCLHYHH